MRIGVFHPSIKMYGGAEVVAIAMANTLARNGYHVTLFTNERVDQKEIIRMMGKPLDSSVTTQVKSFFLTPRGTFHIYESAFRSLSFKLGCDLLLDTYSCGFFPWTDVIYVHFPYFNNIDFKSTFPYLKTKPQRRHVLALPYVFLEKNLGNYSDKLLLANSLFTARVVEETIGADSKILYPPVSDTLFSRKEVDNERCPREDLVVTVARFGPGKGIELIPEIVSLTEKDTKFIVIGLAHDWRVVHSLKNRLRKLGVDDRVTVITDASREEVNCYLSKAKVYLHTKKDEHFGISIAEGMASGCLPIVRDSGGAPEFVPAQYRYRDLFEAAQLVNLTLQNWSQRESMKMKQAAERFSEKNFSKRFIGLFDEYCRLRKKR